MAHSRISPDRRRGRTFSFMLAFVVVAALGAHAPAQQPTDADYAAHAKALKKKVPRGFTVVVEKPFVVAGDEPPARVRARAVRTVRWATTHLRASYFPRDPAHIITVWLFKDKASYRKHVRTILGDSDPSTPFGYYSSAKRALVMNIATGGGTLVHEMVHAFMENNFPQCPSWFNEGLASLYEQCDLRHGKIWGLTNWRLAGLQRAIRAKRVPTFEALTKSTNRGFYDRDPGTNYSQARYLCHYLQERKLLRRFYREFRKSVASDPTGYRTLTRLLGESDMDAFKKRWETYVMRLRFR